MADAFKKDMLDYKLAELGISLEDGIKWTNERMIRKLGDHYINEAKSKGKKVKWGTEYVQSLETVMLCKHLKDEKKAFDENTTPFANPRYISEFKLNGFRCLFTYTPEDGFSFHSRKESVKNYLNGDFTKHILFINKGKIKKPSDYVGKIPLRFVLDCEITVNSDDMIFDNVEYSSAEDYVQAILGSDPERAQAFQKAGHKLVFNIFDVMYFEKEPKGAPPKFKYNYDTDRDLTEEEYNWVESKFENYLLSAGFGLGKSRKKNKKLYQYLIGLRNLSKYDLRATPFEKRRRVRTTLCKYLNKIGMNAVEVPFEDTDKMSFLNEILKDGFEGIILKNLDAPYIAGLKSSRSHRACLKVKQTVQSMLENVDAVEDFDVFITGANKPKSKNITDMIGALNCSVYINKKDGTQVLHEIASISGLTHDLKRQLTSFDENGEIILNPKYLGKVIAINGLALTATNLKFQHAVIKGNNFEFKAKNPTECVWDEEELEKLVITRGI